MYRLLGSVFIRTRNQGVHLLNAGFFFFVFCFAETKTFLASREKKNLLAFLYTASYMKKRTVEHYVNL